MNLKLCLLLLCLYAVIISAQSKKEKPGHKHEEKKHDKHDEARNQGKHGKKGKGRLKALTAEFDTSDSDDDDDDDHHIDWLLELQDVRGKCDPNQCRNGGICEQKKDNFKCKCPKPFKGRRCERRKNVCKKGVCGIGLCLLTSLPPYYKCKCIPPFAPPNCKTPSPCTPNPCQNNGKCVKDDDDFDCVCEGGFSGKYCKVDKNDCYTGDGESYRGKVSETEDGEECLDWNSEFVLDKGFFPAVAFGATDNLGPHNYCRNPDGDRKPWCFIRKNKKLRWDYCNVRKCPTPAKNTTDVVTSKPRTATNAPYQHTTAYVTLRPTIPPNEAATDVVESPTSKPQNVTSSKEVAPTAPHHPVTPSPLTTKDFLTCGKPEPKKQISRIYGGLKAIPGGHPWQVSVQTKPKEGLYYRHTCGGTLIKPCWVLTAAHCIDKKFDYSVMVGGLNLGLNNPPHQTLQVEKIVVHEQYKEAANVVYNDIALLKLKATNGECAKESQLVKTACLPTEPFADGSECSISGWGATETSEYGSAHLLDAQVLLISKEACSMNKLYEAVLDDGMFCAGHLKGGVDSCQGDSGGPLTCQRNQTHYIYGIVSWGDNCGEEGRPGVYTRITKYVDWIKQKITEM